MDTQKHEVMASALNLIKEAGFDAFLHAIWGREEVQGMLLEKATVLTLFKEECERQAAFFSAMASELAEKVHGPGPGVEL